ncbi:MAG: tetratricopeptide repeat protein, partial [Pseudomonadota bacterium]
MIVKRFLLTSFFVSALALSPLQAQQIDRAWMQSQGAAMADALKQEDREKLDDLLRQTLEASAGTDQEMFGLLTHVNVLIQLGEYRDIGPMAERILAREPSLLDGTWNESQTFLQQTAEATRQKGDIEGAISLLRARAAIFAAFQPQEKWMQHVVHNTSFAWAATAQNYSDAGDALERMYRSGPPFSDELKQQMLYMAETFLPLAQFSSSRGESVEAQLGLARLADYASLLGESPPLARAQAVRAVANALEVAGRLKDSEAHLQQALALTPANIDDASMLNERGLILEDIGRLALLRKDWEAAESAFSRADLILADAEKAGAEPSESSDRATRKILRGDVESGLGRHREALALYGEAVATMERRMQSSDMKWNEFPELVQAHIKQSEIYLDLDNKLTAIASARKALAVLRKHGREDDLTMPVNLSNIADAFSAAGELQDGLALMNEALELAKRILPDTSLLIADMATTRATVLERLGKAEQGRAAVAEAADIYRNPINRGRLKEGRLAFAMTAWNAVENGDDALAFEQMQWTQVTEAADAVEATAQRAAATDPVLADALRERQDLIAQIDRTQLQLRQATLTDGASSSDATGVLQANLEQQRDSLAALDRRLADRDYDILGVGGFSPLSLDAAQHLLREDEALVTFLLPGLKADLLGRDTASSNYVLVVKKTGIDVRP